MNPPTIVFLDLEETVIESWDKPFLINTSKVKKWLNTISPDHVGLFSHAVWNSEDLATFNKTVRSTLERALRIQFNDTLLPVLDDIICCVREVRGFTEQSFSQLDFFDFFDKENAFQHFARARRNNFTGRLILLDDTTEDTRLYVNSLIIETVNVKNL